MVEFIMELYHGSFERSEASVEASPYGFLHLCELMSSYLHKKD